MGLFDRFRQASAPAAPMTSREANELLVKAVTAGNVKTAEFALKASGSPNLEANGFYWASSDHHRWKVPEPQPMLWYAVETNNLPMAQLLVQYGADLTKKHRSSTALFLAVVEGRTPIVKMLLEAGAPMDEHYADRSLLGWARVKQYADITKLLTDEPGRRRNIAEAEKRARQEAEAQRLAAVEKAKQAAENPQPETSESIAVMKPLSFKTPKKTGWLRR